MTEENVLKEDFNMSEELEQKKFEQFIETTTNSYKANLEKYRFHKNLLKMMNRDRDARIENHNIMIKNFRPVQAHWEFENNETYQKNLAILQEGLKQQDIENYNANEKQINKLLEVTLEQLKSEKDILEKNNVVLESFEE